MARAVRSDLYDDPTGFLAIGGGGGKSTIESFDHVGLDVLVVSAPMQTHLEIRRLLNDLSDIAGRP